MIKSFPTIGQYNRLIQIQGGNAFRRLYGISFIPSRTLPIKVYLFGSGAFAAVFKGSLNGKTYAIRCFLSSENEAINRYTSICNYLKKINSSWKTECEFMEDELVHEGTSYPILGMEWMDGLLINQFVSENLSSNSVLSKLQEKLVLLSEDLERNKVGHGDIQCGNIIVSGSATDFQLKLIDYDGMYVPDLDSKISIERGRSEFQHPKRSLNNYSPEMDRFSFWVLITALEALKLDKTLWREVMQGGFNTLDNFLFTIQDFLNPNQSALFGKLVNINSSALKFYVETLKWLCNSDYSIIPPPALYQNNSESLETRESEQFNDSYREHSFGGQVSDGKFKIVTMGGNASVLTSTFQYLGSTPLELDKELYKGKLILISNGRDTKRISLDPNQSLIEIKFD